MANDRRPNIERLRVVAQPKEFAGRIHQHVVLVLRADRDEIVCRKWRYNSRRWTATKVRYPARWIVGCPRMTDGLRRKLDGAAAAIGDLPDLTSAELEWPRLPRV